VQGIERYHHGLEGGKWLRGKDLEPCKRGESPNFAGEAGSACGGRKGRDAYNRLRGRERSLQGKFPASTGRKKRPKIRKKNGSSCPSAKIHVIDLYVTMRTPVGREKNLASLHDGNRKKKVPASIT